MDTDVLLKAAAKLNDKFLGDLTVKDRGDLGLDLHNRMQGNEKLCFLTQGGELGLLDWLREKYPRGRKSDGVALGHRKAAGYWSELLSSLNPLNAYGGSLAGGGIALMTPTRSMSQQAKSDVGGWKTVLQNLLIPGVGPYRGFKRLGTSIRGPELKAEKSEARRRQAEDKELKELEDWQMSTKTYDQAKVDRLNELLRKKMQRAKGRGQEVLEFTGEDQDRMAGAKAANLLKAAQQLTGAGEGRGMPGGGRRNQMQAPCPDDGPGGGKGKGKGKGKNRRIVKEARKLTPAARKRIPKKKFAVPAKADSPKEKAKPGGYPMPDAQHARSALGFAAMHHGKDSDVYRRVAAKAKSLGYGGEKKAVLVDGKPTPAHPRG